MTSPEARKQLQAEKMALARKRAAERKAAEEATANERVSKTAGPVAGLTDDMAELAPDVDGAGSSRKDRHDEEDRAMASLGIVSVYEKLTGSAAGKVSGGSDELLVFCPSADHTNTNSEAACLNTAKNTWVCYGQCDSGGGLVDLSAATLGLPIGKNLKGSEYARAKEHLLVECCGWVRVKSGKFTEVKSPAQIAAEEKEFEERHAAPRVLESVKPLKETGEESESSGTRDRKSDDLPEISNIMDHLPEGTPLYEYMKANQKQNHPREFDLFNALGLIGLAVGPFLRGQVSYPFKPGMFILRIGRSGSGKSTSDYAVREILRHISMRWTLYPANVQDGFTHHQGVKELTPPGSGEALLDEFSVEFRGGERLKVRDVKGWLPIDEFRTFLTKANARGSTLLPIFLDLENRVDMDDEVKTVSRAGGKTVAINPQVLFTTTIQPNAFRDLVGSSNVDNGLLSRFEVVTGNALHPDLETNLTETVRPDMSDAQEAYGKMHAYYENRRADTYEIRKIITIRAHESASEYINSSARKLRHLEQSDNGAQSRFVLKMCKYSLLFALNRNSDFIMKEDVQNAMWVMEYLSRTTAYADAKVSETVFTEMDEKILSAVRFHYTKGLGYATQSQISNYIKAPKHGWDTGMIVKTLRSLIDAGLIEEQPSLAKRGKKSDWYVPLTTDDWHEPRSAKYPKEAK